MKENLLRLLESIYGKSVQIKTSKPTSGGCINQTQVISLSKGERVFLKYNPSPPKTFFTAEASGLRTLAKVKNGPRVPLPLGVSSEPNPQFLLMEYIEPSPSKSGCPTRFARALAEMHRETQEQYGFDHDTFIGSTVQINNIEFDGVVFFREHRIRFQQELARKTRGLPKDMDRRLDKFCRKLETLLDFKNEKPA